MRVVREELEGLGLTITDLKLGEAIIQGTVDKSMMASIEKSLHKNGFELIDDRKSKLIESIKNIIIQTIHHEDLSDKKIIWSELISRKLNYEYKYLSQLFSSVEGVTIEHFIILHKIEKAKEYLVYDELTLSEIAWKLDYSSVAHLSNQFKKVTGLTPKSFKQIGKNKRKFLDKV